MATREEIRQKTLGNTRSGDKATVLLDDGTPIVVKCPTFKKQTDILSRCRVGEDGIDMALNTVLLVIHFCVDEDGNQVFDESDIEFLLNIPSNCDWFAALASKIRNFVAEDVEGDDGAVGNSDGTVD